MGAQLLEQDGRRSQELDVARAPHVDTGRLLEGANQGDGQAVLQCWISRRRVEQLEQDAKQGWRCRAGQSRRGRTVRERTETLGELGLPVQRPPSSP